MSDTSPFKMRHAEAAATTERCRVCGAAAPFIFSQAVLGRPVSYFDCGACGYVQTEMPYWLDQAYSSAINDVDTGILWRNSLNLRRVVMTLVALGRLHGTVIDHAGGYGILVRLLRDAGVDALWRDKYCENLLARGFEAHARQCDLVTAFEVFEHLVDPLTELSVMLEQAPAVLISTELVLRDDAPPRTDWWYLGPEHGQHVGFFRRRTLEYLAQKLNCDYRTDGRSLHLFCLRRVPATWLPLQRGVRLGSLVARIMLRSKTMADFDQLRARRLPPSCS